MSEILFKKVDYTLLKLAEDSITRLWQYREGNQQEVTQDEEDTLKDAIFRLYALRNFPL